MITTGPAVALSAHGHVIVLPLVFIVSTNLLSGQEKPSLYMLTCLQYTTMWGPHILLMIHIPRDYVCMHSPALMQASWRLKRPGCITACTALEI